MQNPIVILLIDDDIDYYYSLKNIAAKSRIILKHSNNLKEGIQLLKESKKIMGVILDGRGFISANQERGSEKADFVHQALTELALLENEQNRIIPKCVLTAWYEKLVESLETRVKVYDKKTLNPEELFSFMRNEINDSDLYKIRKDFQKIFDSIYESGLNEENDKRLFYAIHKLEYGVIEKSDFNNLRDILESVFKRINVVDESMLPGNLFFPNGRPNLEYCTRFLLGYQVGIKETILYEKNDGPRISEHIAKSIDFIKNSTSIFSHDYQEIWTNNFFQSILFSLCEVLLWLKEFNESKYVKDTEN